MSGLLRRLSSQHRPQVSPIPTGTPHATPSDWQSELASHESRNATTHETSDAEGQPEDVIRKTAGQYTGDCNESTTRPRSVSPDAPAHSPAPTHCSETDQRPGSSSVPERLKPRPKISQRMRALNPRLVLQNSGSVARDHLASERTFLAYVRTSLAIASAGVALVQLFTIADLTSRNVNVPLSNSTLEVQKLARPLGVVAVVFAFIVLVIGELPLSSRCSVMLRDMAGLYRYFLIQNALPEQRFPTARVSIAFTSFVMGGVIVTIFVALLKSRVQ
ncbi:hypothetical protein BJ912DRAFT_418390 [Pholiota molesta]|nr:hypothetical protein BJ912DRAFT_418390 [Pholiota molesta]